MTAAFLDVATAPARPRGLGGGDAPRTDLVAVEEPLEIQVQGVSIAVVMRTPGHDFELVRGFLVTERVLSRADEIHSLRHCDVAQSPEAEDNIVQVRLRDEVPFDVEPLRRNLFANSSCGVCGKATIESALAASPPLEDPVRIDARLVASWPRALGAAQPLFDRTGGVHGAALFDSTGALVVAREDVGRHNAVDKVIGWALEHHRIPLTGHVLMVSGRTSFEIVQKAAAARIAVVAAVSAPSSLAVGLADRLGITLLGFVRGASANVYTHSHRIV